MRKSIIFEFFNIENRGDSGLAPHTETVPHHTPTPCPGHHERKMKETGWNNNTSKWCWDPRYDS